MYCNILHIVICDWICTIVHFTSTIFLVVSQAVYSLQDYVVIDNTHYNKSTLAEETFGRFVDQHFVCTLVSYCTSVIAKNRFTGVSFYTARSTEIIFEALASGFMFLEQPQLPLNFHDLARLSFLCKSYVAKSIVM